MMKNAGQLRMKLFGVLLSMLFGQAALALPVGEALRLLPVQDAGRIKPYDTFGRETLEVVYGKKTFEGKQGWEVALTWMLAPTIWAEKEIFEVRNKEVLKRLGLDESRRWFKGDDIFGKDKFPELMQELRVRRENKEKLTPYFQALQRIENQWFVFREMAAGRLMKVMPNTESDAWISLADLPDPGKQAFLPVTQSFVAWLSATSLPDSTAEQKRAAGEALDAAVKTFQNVMHPTGQSDGASIRRMELEVHYNDFHPFRWAYVFYLIAALILLLVWTLDKPQSWVNAAWVFVAIGFLLNTYGFVLRVYLADRPPVSNMYETVVWVAWGGIVFAAILELIYRSRFILLAGTLVAIVSLIVADSAPVVLDPSLQPLEAVLRSNYWLIVHVMTIVISYAAFFLAFMLGDLGLLVYFRGRPGSEAQLKGIVNAIYRSMQIGVAFIAPGIILGGVWADESWGRFWGWDPKETWALIVLLGYLAVLHGRMSGLIRDFGMIVSAVVTFSLVIMAWYGVNFVLGAGLHSYGFGAGGVEYVSAFVGVHILAVIYVWVLMRSRGAVRK